MEIRLLPRQSGITTWILRRAGINALTNSGSENLVLVANYDMVEAAYDMLLEIVGENKGMPDVTPFSKRISCGNGSIIELTTFSSFLGDCHTHAFSHGMYLFIDNVDFLIKWTHSFRRGIYTKYWDVRTINDIVVGGTIERWENGVLKKEGECNLTMDCGDFFKHAEKFFGMSNNKLGKFEFFCGLQRVVTVLYKKCFLKEPMLEFRSEEDFCDKQMECKKNGCAHCGSDFFVCEECPCYADFFVYSQNRKIKA